MNRAIWPWTAMAGGLPGEPLALLIGRCPPLCAGPASLEAAPSACPSRSDFLVLSPRPPVCTPPHWWHLHSLPSTEAAAFTGLSQGRPVPPGRSLGDERLRRGGGAVACMSIADVEPSRPRHRGSVHAARVIVSAMGFIVSRLLCCGCANSPGGVHCPAAEE